MRVGLRLGRYIVPVLLLGALLLPAVTPPVHAAPATLGHVRWIHRGLTVQPPHRKAGKGKVHQALFTAYHLSTRALQRASLTFADGSLLHLDQRTVAILRSPSITMVKRGQVDQVVVPGATHTVQTAAAVASAVGTNFNVRVKGKKTTVVVVEGAVLVSNGAGSVLVKTDQKTTVVAGLAPSTPVAAKGLSTIKWTGQVPAPKAPVGMNIALDANGGTVVDASSTRQPSSGQDLWIASHINDGRLDSGWATAAGHTTNEWIKLELPKGDLHPIRSIILDPAATGGQDPANDLKDFQIRISTTDSADASFTTVLQATAAQANALKRFDLPPQTTARYVELVALSNYGGTDGINVAELEVIAAEQVLAARPHIHHLAGQWMDGSNPIVITQHGDSIVGRYVKPYVCDLRDGTGRKQTTSFDFSGVIDFDTVIGKTSVCSYGHGNPLGVGLKLTTLTLTISADNEMMKGYWYNASTRSKEPETLTRTG